MKTYLAGSIPNSKNNPNANSDYNLSDITKRAHELANSWKCNVWVAKYTGRAYSKQNTYICGTNFNLQDNFYYHTILTIQPDKE